MVFIIHENIWSCNMLQWQSIITQMYWKGSKKRYRTNTVLSKTFTSHNVFCCTQCTPFLWFKGQVDAHVAYMSAWGNSTFSFHVSCLCSVFCSWRCCCEYMVMNYYHYFKSFFFLSASGKTSNSDPLYICIDYYNNHSYYL